MDFDALYLEAQGHGHVLSISLQEFKDMMAAATRGKLLEEYRPSHEMLVDCIDILHIDGSCLVARHTLCSRIYRKLGVPRNSTDVYSYQQAGTDFRTLPRPRRNVIVATNFVPDVESSDDEVLTDVATRLPAWAQTQTAAASGPSSGSSASSGSSSASSASSASGIEPTAPKRDIGSISTLEEAAAESAAQRKDALDVVHRAAQCLADVSAIKELDELKHIGDMIQYTMTELAAIEGKRRQLAEDDEHKSKRAKHSSSSSVECPVCMESTDENNCPRVLIKCGHVVCTACVRRMVDIKYHPTFRIEEKVTCPVCREDTSSVILRI